MQAGARQRWTVGLTKRYVTVGGPISYVSRPLVSVDRDFRLFLGIVPDPTRMRPNREIRGN